MVLTLDLIDRLTEEEAKVFLKRIVPRLDEADQDDMLGTEGWRNWCGLEE